jgi:hypothetical protein
MVQTLKCNLNAFCISKPLQTLYEAKFEHVEQLSPLSQLQIPTRIHVINFGTNSNLNLPPIFMGFKPCRKNLVNSLKFYIDLIFTKVNLVEHTCMQEIGVPIQVSKCLV